MIYFLLFLFSYSLTFLIKNFAIKKVLLSDVNERSSHEYPTPYGGGIAIAISWFLGLIYLYFSKQIEINLLLALLPGALLFAVGILDDIFDLSVKLRLFVHIIVSTTGFFLLDSFENNEWLIIGLSILFIIYYINITNFMDGINGYVGSMFVFLSLSCFMIFSNSVYLILAVSVLGFLFWNWNKAKIFMGDSGSTLLGYNLSIISLYHQSQDTDFFLIMIILYSLFLYDATITIIRRFLNKEKLNKAHKKHAYQRLILSGWSHFKVTNYSILINLIILSIVIFFEDILFISLIVFVLLTIIYLFIERKRSFE